MPETSIIIKSGGDYASSVKQMAEVTRSFSKDNEELQKTLDRLRESHRGLKDDIKATSDELKALQKAYKETGDAADKLKVDETAEKLDRMRQNYNLVGRAATAATRAMEENAGVFRKTSNDLGETLFSSGIGRMLSQAAQQGANAIGSSALGSGLGDVFSSVLSSAIQGGTIGSMVGQTGLGTAIGAGVGLLNGATSVFTGADEAFKSYYTGQVSQGQTSRANELTGGISTAAQREQDLLSFTTLLGDAGAATGLMSYIKDFANRTPYFYSDLTSIAKQLSVYGYDTGGIKEGLTAIGDTGAALSLSNADMETVAGIIGYINISENLDATRLRYLRLRGINANQMLADSYGMSVSDFNAAVTAKEIGGADAAERLIDKMEEWYGGMMEKQAETYTGINSTVEGLKENINAAEGEAYDRTLMTSLRAERAAYEGGLGEELSLVNSVIGEGKGLAENLSRTYSREALEAVFLGKDTTVYAGEQAATLKGMNETYNALMDRYETASDEEKAVIAQQLEDLKTQAESFAETAYNASDVGKGLVDAEVELIEAIRENTAALGSFGWNASWRTNRESSKGMASTWDLTGGTGDYYGGLDYSQIAGIQAGNAVASLLSGGGYATGLERVPYDNFPALLHEGERVLTASEARSADRGGRPITVSIGEVRFGADMKDPDTAAERFAAALKRALETIEPVN